MISNVTLNWPNIIEFGSGKIKTLLTHLQDSKRAFVLIDPPILEKLKPLLEELKNGGCELQISTEVVPEPPFQALESLIEPVAKFNPDTVVGIGGGSAMDLAKLVAVLFTKEQKAQEIIGIGQVKSRTVKLVTASTTSGTGSEVTPIAILTDEENQLKKGVVSEYLVPDVAIIDPDLTLSLPPAVTAATAMDAMTHCIEAYTNVNSHPVIDNIAIEGVHLIAQNIEKCIKDGADLEARTALALGSLYGGMCLGPVNTAAVHAMAYPLGGTFKISHGVSNSVLLPFVMKHNLPNCMQKYANIAIACGVEFEDHIEKLADSGIKKIKEISNNCGIPSGLKELNIPEDAIDTMAANAIKVERLMNNNPRKVTLEDAKNIYANAFKGVL